MEAAAQWSNVITASIAIFASLTGVIWWFYVRQRRTKIVREDLDNVVDKVKEMSNFFDEVAVLLKDEKSSESEKNRSLLMLIDQRISNVHFLFFLHFIHSNFRPHETPDLLKRITDLAKEWSFRSPFQSPLVRRDVEQPGSNQGQ